MTAVKCTAYAQPCTAPGQEGVAGNVPDIQFLVEQGVVYLTNILGYSIPYLRGEYLSCLMVGVGEQE